MATTRRTALAALLTFALLLLAGLGIAVLLQGVRVDSALAHPIETPWAARVLLVLSVAWLLIGALAARTRLVGRPGAAAARATWIGSTRPWRARESTLGSLELDRALMVIIPGGLLVATVLVEAPAIAPASALVTLAGWAAFVLIVAALLRGRSPWPLIATVGGVVVLRCVFDLVVLSVGDPVAFLSHPSAAVPLRAMVFALSTWLLIAVAWALAAQLGVRRSIGAVLAGAGAGVALPELVVALAQLAQPLTAWSDRLALVPWGAARVLGDPMITSWVIVAAGLVVGIAGLVVATVRSRRH